MGSGVRGAPEGAPKTKAVLGVLEAAGYSVEKKFDGNPIMDVAAWTMRCNLVEDGTFFASTGNYLHGPRGAWVEGSGAVLALALRMGLRVSKRWREEFNRSVSDDERLLAAFDGDCRGESPVVEQRSEREVIKAERRKLMEREGWTRSFPRRLATIWIEAGVMKNGDGSTAATDGSSWEAWIPRWALQVGLCEDVLEATRIEVIRSAVADGVQEALSSALRSGRARGASYVREWARGHLLGRPAVGASNVERYDEGLNEFVPDDGRPGYAFCGSSKEGAATIWVAPCRHLPRDPHTRAAGDDDTLPPCPTQRALEHASAWFDSFEQESIIVDGHGVPTLDEES